MAYVRQTFNNGAIPQIDSTYMNAVEAYLSNLANNAVYDPTLAGGVVAKTCVYNNAGTWTATQFCRGVVDGETNVVLNGIASGLTSLTAGTVYYSTSAGALSATKSPVEVGIALSTTTLFVNIKVSELEAPKAITDAAYTLIITDRDYLLECTRATAQTITVPLNSSVAFPIGTRIGIAQYGAGTVSVAATAGVTVNAVGLDLTAQWKTAALLKTATDTWLLAGSLE